MLDPSLGYCVSADAGTDAASDAPTDADLGATDLASDASDLGASDSGTDAGVDLGADAGPTTRAEVVDALRNAVCAKAIYCASQDAAPTRLCHPSEFSDLVGADGSTGAGFDPSATAACVAVLEDPMWRHTCSQQESYFDDACLRALAGTGAVGTRCTSDFQCAGACPRDGFGGHMCGSCVALGTPGSACAPSLIDHCAHGLGCTLHGCGVLAGLAGGCTAPFDCAGDMTCNSAGLCQATDLGGACDSALPDTCTGDLVCTTAADAGVCATGSGVGSACDGGHRCQPGLYCTTSHVCAHLAGPGEICTGTADCTPMFRCIGGLCVAQPDVGGTCTASLPCRTGGCVAGTCTPLADGATCTATSECAGRCASGTCAPRYADGTAGCSTDRECLPDSACVGSLTPHCNHCP